MVSLSQTSHHIWMFFITTSRMDLTGMVNVHRDILNYPQMAGKKHLISSFFLGGGPAYLRSVAVFFRYILTPRFWCWIWWKQCQIQYSSFPSAIRVSLIGKFTAAFEKVVKRSRRSQAALLALKIIWKGIGWNYHLSNQLARPRKLWKLHRFMFSMQETSWRSSLWSNKSEMVLWYWTRFMCQNLPCFKVKNSVMMQ